MKYKLRPPKEGLHNIREYGRAKFTISYPQRQLSSDRSRVDDPASPYQISADGKIHVIWDLDNPQVEAYFQRHAEQNPHPVNIEEAQQAEGAPSPPMNQLALVDESPNTDDNLENVAGVTRSGAGTTRGAGVLSIMDEDTDVTVNQVILEAGFQQPPQITGIRLQCEMRHPETALSLADPPPSTVSSPRQTELFKFIYEDGCQVEYFSATQQMWMPATVHPVVRHVRRSDLHLDTVVMYNVKIQGARTQEQHNVPLDALRLPLQASEFIEVFSLRNNGIWLPAIVNGPQVPWATAIGYQVLLTESAEVLEMIPPVRIRRRFPANLPISVYQGCTVGWVNAAVHRETTSDGTNAEPVPELEGPSASQWTNVRVRLVALEDSLEEMKVPSYLIRNRDPTKLSERVSVYL